MEYFFYSLLFITIVLLIYAIFQYKCILKKIKLKSDNEEGISKKEYYELKSDIHIHKIIGIIIISIAALLGITNINSIKETAVENVTIEARKNVNDSLKVYAKEVYAEYKEQLSEDINVISQISYHTQNLLSGGHPDKSHSFKEMLRLYDADTNKKYSLHFTKSEELIRQKFKRAWTMDTLELNRIIGGKSTKNQFNSTYPNRHVRIGDEFEFAIFIFTKFELLNDTTVSIFDLESIKKICNKN